jgi:hypothetical protein
MEGGTYRIDIAVTARLPVPEDRDAHTLADRLSALLPEGAEITEMHTDPATNGIEAVAMLTGDSPAHALQKLVGGAERLAVAMRVETGHDPFGPRAVLRRVCVTHVAGPPSG